MFSMQHAFLSFRSSRILYSSWGTGNKILICFHGYGESAGSFELLTNHLPPDQYRMIAIDFPFHGRTMWEEDKQFTVDDLIVILDVILETLGIGPEKFSILGFSLGGRMALSLTEKIPTRIKKLFLLAPDGLKKNGWYRLATQNWIGNTFFRLTMKYPGLFFSILKTSRALRITSQQTYSFTTYYIQDKQAREDLYQRWTVLQKFHPVLGKIKSLIIQNEIPVKLFFGVYDRIVRFESGKEFRKGMEPFCDVIILPCGHQVLQEKNMQVLSQSIKE
jgi:pimeloyl-ACP methyl ester carboxylesterase